LLQPRVRLPVAAEGEPARGADSRRREDAKGRQQHSMIRAQGSGIGGQGRAITNLHAIVFDFDGVIADSERLHLRSYQEILAPEGITMSNEDYFNRYLGYDDVGVFKAVGRDQGVAMDEGRVSELIERKGRRYESLAAAGEMPFPGPPAFIRAAAPRLIARRE